MPGTIRAIDRLRKAASLEPAKKVVELSDGTKFEMWVSPLTMAERERAQRQAKSDDPGAFEIDVLKNEVKDKDLQSLMLAILNDDEEPIDPNS
jgi:hypothetical protein